MIDSNSQASKQLIYMSEISEDSFESELFNMIRKSQKFNISEGISSFLLSDNKYLVQIIEGSESSVDNLFNKIKTDSRHHNVEIKFEEMTNFRTMPLFGMGLCLVNSNVNFQQDFYFTRHQAREFTTLFEGAVGIFFRKYLFLNSSHLSQTSS